MFLVYKIVNDINNKIYIGQTCESLEKRFKRHTGYQINYPDAIHRAIKKYGKEHFKIELICEAKNQQELDDLELINILKYDKKMLYNEKYVKGKCGGDTLSKHKNKAEISDKIRKSKIGRKNPKAVGVIAYNIKNNTSKTYGAFSECVSDMNLTDHTVIARHIGKDHLYKKTWYFERAGVQTIGDECSRVDSEISTESKRKAQ